MSFMLTTEQIRNRTKDVTRRVGWWNLKDGELVQAVEKGMGLKKGEKMVKLAVIRIVSARPEPLHDITADDVRREGFPQMTREEFIKFFHRTHKLKYGFASIVNRIEFEYV